MKRMVLIDLKFHIKTQSTLFLYEIFEKEYEVTYVRSDMQGRVLEGIEKARGKKYDVLVLLQVMPELHSLNENFMYKQGVLIPMYDGIVNRECDIFFRYRFFKIICFSETLYRQLSKKGYKTYYIKYFPEPINNETYGDNKSIFLWQRSEMININTVATLMRDIDIDHIHIHKSPDPGQRFIEPLDEMAASISYSEWFDNSTEIYDIMKESAFYFAPRVYEGIGMGFLKAMAMGRCVIAPNTPTMNEYIEDGINGFLYDLRNLSPLKIENVREIQKNAENYIISGYNEWEKSKNNILKWLEEDIDKPLVTVITVERNIFKSGKERAFFQCISSVHNQLYPNIQHIVIDRDSQDGTLNILEQYKELNWIEFILESDISKYAAMNKGLINAKGKYIIFLNSDSYINNPNAIKESVFALENGQADFSFASNILLRSAESKELLCKPTMGRFVIQMPFDFQSMLLSSTMLKTLGRLSEKYEYLAEYELILKALLKGYKYVEIERVMVTCRQSLSSKESCARMEEEKRLIYIQIYQKYLEDIEAFAELLVKGLLPIKLFDELKKDISLELINAISSEIMDVDEKEQVYYLKEASLKPVKKGEEDNVNSYLEYREKEIVKERLNKFTRYFTALNHWLELKIQNKNISTYFADNNFDKVAIYGFGEIGKRLWEELSYNSEIEVLYAIDKRIKIHPTLRIYSLEDELPEVDVIVVSVNYTFEEVRQMLEKKANAMVISIDEVIFSIK